MDDARFAEVFACLEALNVREDELRSVGGAASGDDDPQRPAENLHEAAARRAFAGDLASLGAVSDEIALAQRERGELLRELVAGLPQGTWLRHPLDDRKAVMAHDTDGAGPGLFYAPWRLASQAPPGSRPESVYRAGEELRSGLVSRLRRSVNPSLWAVAATTAPVLLFGEDGPRPYLESVSHGTETAALFSAALVSELLPLAGCVLWLVASARFYLAVHFLLFRYLEPAWEILAQERLLAPPRTGPPHEANGPVPAERTP